MSGEPDWGELFGALSDRFGWLPAQIAELTYPQLQAYTRYMGSHPARYVYACAPPKR